MARSSVAPPPHVRDWRSACLFMATDPGWKREIGIGGWILLIPVIGWPAVLGYRTEAISRLVGGEPPVLPAWRNRLRDYISKGLKAILVINTWYVPILFWLVWRLNQSPHCDLIPWFPLAAFFLCVPILSTMIVPALLWYSQLGLPEPAFTFPEAALISLLFGLVTFIIPAGFMNVTRTGSYLKAFQISWIVRTIAHNFRAYTEAWIGSSIIALIGHFCFPATPWGIVWAYLAIVYLFNDIPLSRAQHEDVCYLAGSWFRKMDTGYWDRMDCDVTRWTRHYKPASPEAQDHMCPVLALKIGPVFIPLPISQSSSGDVDQ